MPGIQNDEALFATGIYQPLGYVHRLRAFGHDIPLMIMTYVGALKSILYAGIFWLWPPSPASVRVPVLLLGALTVWLFYLLLRRVAGERAGVIGAGLLATDAVYLLTVRMDWGPVAIQHLMLVGGVLSLLYRRVGLGFFLFGLGMWDKALFSWALIGLAAATLAVYPRELWRELTLRRAVIAVVAFAAGTFPLIRYNVKHPLATFEGNTKFATEELMQKVEVARVTLDGSGMLQFAIREDADSPTRPGRNVIERAVVKLSELSGSPRSNWMVPAFVLSLAGLFTPAGRKIAWALVFMLVVWAQMTFNRDTGGALHHTVLIWPFPLFVVAVAVAQLPRWPSAAVAAFLVATNLLTLNHSLALAIRNGGTPNWSDAVYPLTERLMRADASKVIIVDWGYSNTLQLFGQGAIPVYFANDAFKDDDLTSGERGDAAWFFADPRALYVSRSEAAEEYAGSNRRLRVLADSLGYLPADPEVIYDRQGRPIYQVFRVVPKDKGILTAAPGTGDKEAASSGTGRTKK